MELESKKDVEVKRIERVLKYQIPNKFKIVGLILFLVSLLSIIMISIFLENEKYYDLFAKIAKSLVLMGLLLISISKEKIEDELVEKLRMQSYVYSSITVVLFVLIIPFINYIIVFVVSSTPKIENVSDFTIIGLLLSMQIVSFCYLKRPHNEK